MCVCVCVCVCARVRVHFSQEVIKLDIYFFIIKGFRTIVFIFIVISTTFRPICHPAFFRGLSNSGTYTELWTTSFIESTWIAWYDSVSHNWVQVSSIPVLLLACSQDWTCNLQMIVSLEARGTNAYNRYAMCPAGQSWLLASNNTGILDTCTQLRITKSEQVTPVDSVKDVDRSSV